MWDLTLDFFRKIEDSFDNYDYTDVWPTIIDDYVSNARGTARSAGYSAGGFSDPYDTFRSLQAGIDTWDDTDAFGGSAFQVCAIRAARLCALVAVRRDPWYRTYGAR